MQKIQAHVPRMRKQQACILRMRGTLEAAKAQCSDRLYCLGHHFILSHNMYHGSCLPAGSGLTWGAALNDTEAGKPPERSCSTGAPAGKASFGSLFTTVGSLAEDICCSRFWACVTASFIALFSNLNICVGSPSSWHVLAANARILL